MSNVSDISYEPEELNFRELMDYYGYSGFFGRLKLRTKLARSWFLHVLASHSPSSDLTVKLHRARGTKIGRHVYIGPDVHIDWLYPHLITIEDYVSIGMKSMIFAHSNPTNSLFIKVKYYPRIVKPVRIKTGAWIAPACIILPGVTIGENSVVGAGSVVNKDVEPYTVVAGVPAKLVKKLERS
jgi:acetyltransferase-like isoleucine patch superfamily enzyme